LFGTIGAKRLIAPALRIAQLPPIDLVVLSHAHMDHCDPATLRNLPGTPQIVTAKATADVLRNTQPGRPTELGWGESARIETENGDALVQAFEVNHWGARWRFDTKRGYNGYVISREGKKIIFGGDTAWTETFRSLRGGGPYEMAIMPIGAYQPWINSHCTPEQAVRMAEDAGAEHFLPVHFKTFALGREGVYEPLERLEGCIEGERIAVREVGETFKLC
jgi:L-ascorbate metabolism protein UlaG (beta-lactamase superfamily)